MDVQAVLLDLQGVLYEAGAPYDGAVDAVARLGVAGLAIRFLTNKTTQPLHAIAAHMRGMGFDVEPGQLFTPILAARGVLDERGIRRVHLAAGPALAEDLAGYTLCDEDAEAIVLGDLERAFTWDRLNGLFAMMRDGALLIALHKNRYCRRGDGLGLDLGPFVAALEYATRSEAIVAGKPSPTFFQMALRDMRVEPRDAVMVGDDIDSDIGGGLGAGMTTVQVRTGKYSKADQTVAIQPAYRIDSIKDLPDRLGL
jgi:phospholysine phosphohistidine inorganic pyrophosphate phosphatase